MAASTGSPIKAQVKKIDGLSVRYAESAARRVGDPPQLVARKPLHLRADVVASCRGASPRSRGHQAGRYARSPIFYREGHLVHRAVTTAGARIGPWLTSL
jgi:hypothetical protein